MSKPLTQTEQAALGIILLRGLIDRNQPYWPDHQLEALTALCDYAEKAITARRAGGQAAGMKAKGDVSRFGGKRAQKPGEPKE